MTWKTFGWIVAAIGGAFGVYYCANAVKEHKRKEAQREEERKATEEAWRDKMSDIAKEEAAKAQCVMAAAIEVEIIGFEERLERVCHGLQEELNSHAAGLKQQLGA